MLFAGRCKKEKKKKEVFSFQMLVSPRFQLWKGGSVTHFGKDVQDLSKILWDMVASGERSHSVVWQSGGFCLSSVCAFLRTVTVFPLVLHSHKENSART